MPGSRTLLSVLSCALLLAGCRSGPVEPSTSPPVSQTPPATVPADVPAPAPDTPILRRVVVPLALPRVGEDTPEPYIEQLRVVVWDASDPFGPSREVGETIRPIFPAEVDGSTLTIAVELPDGLPEGTPVYITAEITNSRQHVFALSTPMLPGAPEALSQRVQEVAFRLARRDVFDTYGHAPTTFISCGGLEWSLWEFGGLEGIARAQLDYRHGGDPETAAALFESGNAIKGVRRIPSRTGRQFAERDWGDDADVFIDDTRALLSLGRTPWQSCSITQHPLAPDHPLVGKWDVVALDGRAVLPDTEPSISIRADLGLGAYAGCNGGGGRFRLEGDRLVLASMNQTLMGCPGPLGDQEDALFGRIGESPVWTVEQDRLLLRTDEGGTVEARRAKTEATP